MIGVVLAAHGSIGPALLEAAESIVGPLDDVRAFSIEPGSDPTRLRDSVQGAIRELEQGDGVLVLCDMFGGTPANLCLGADCGRVEVVTGVNLPMLLKMASIRSEGLSLEDAAGELARYGRRHIVQATEILRGRQGRSEPGSACENDDAARAHR